MSLSIVTYTITHTYIHTHCYLLRCVPDSLKTINSSTHTYTHIRSHLSLEVHIHGSDLVFLVSELSLDDCAQLAEEALLEGAQSVLQGSLLVVG